MIGRTLVLSINALAAAKSCCRAVTLPPNDLSHSKQDWNLLRFDLVTLTLI